MRDRQAFVEEDTNDYMDAYRILCGTTNNASERMWKDYAQEREDVVLRIEPNLAKSSKLDLFRPVLYDASRPSLYDATMDFLQGSLFEDPAARSSAILETIIYTKTLPYKFEKEYRLVIPAGDEGDCETLPYHQ
jgi:hypothetical protein